MKNNLIRAGLVAGVVALLAAVACAMGSPYYIAEPFSARVVDAISGKPVTGAIVVANWQLVRGGFDGEHNVGQLEVRETVTDEFGKFSFDGFTKINPTLAELRNADPRVLIFKGGYEAQYQYSQIRGPRSYPGARRKAAIDGDILKLQPLHSSRTGPAGDRYAFHKHLHSMALNLVQDCAWQRAPRLFAAMDEEKRHLQEDFPGSYVDIGIEDFTNWSDSPCRLTKDALKEILR